jgi:hypothetical protein
LFAILKNLNAIQALKTLRIRNCAVLLDRIVIAADLAQLTRRAAGFAAFDPIAASKQAADCHDGAEWADIAAEPFENHHPEQ